MRTIGIIPARYASTRLPGKPLKMIGDVSLIMRVYNQAIKTKGLTDVVVATDDERIMDHVLAEGGKALMTSSDHDTGTSRCFDAYSQLNEEYDFVINIQGDEPFVNPEQLQSIIDSFDGDKEIITMYKKIEGSEVLMDPNTPKIVIGENERAIYFSRSPIPHMREKQIERWLDNGSYYQHLGIYAYRTDILTTIVKLEPSIIETMEKLEQLRWLANGVKIHLVETKLDALSVDTEQDLEKARSYIRED